MKRPSLLPIILVAALFVILASPVLASVANCGLTPYAPACAPQLSLSWSVKGNSPGHDISGGLSAWNSLGYWETNLAPQNLGSLYFTGGLLQSNPDPFVSFSFGVINDTASTIMVQFDFITPFSGGPYVSAQTFFADSLIHTAFDNGTSTVLPDPNGGYYNYISTSLVDGNVIPGFQFGLGCTTDVNTHICSSPDDNALATHYLTGVTGFLEIKGQFTLTPNSNYSLEGETDLYPVPEPTSLLLLGSGVIGLGRYIRRWSDR